jgi:hypothetical protein
MAPADVTMASAGGACDSGRRPAWPRVKSELWNPDDRRLFPPKSFGWGLGLNFYELFRRIGLVRLV